MAPSMMESIIMRKCHMTSYKLTKQITAIARHELHWSDDSPLLWSKEYENKCLQIYQRLYGNNNNNNNNGNTSGNNSNCNSKGNTNNTNTNNNTNSTVVTTPSSTTSPLRRNVVVVVQRLHNDSTNAGDENQNSDSDSDNPQQQHQQQHHHSHVSSSPSSSPSRRPKEKEETITKMTKKREAARNATRSLSRPKRRISKTIIKSPKTPTAPKNTKTSITTTPKSMASSSSPTDTINNKSLSSSSSLSSLSSLEDDDDDESIHSNNNIISSSPIIRRPIKNQSISPFTSLDESTHSNMTSPRRPQRHLDFIERSDISSITKNNNLYTPTTTPTTGGNTKRVDYVMDLPIRTTSTDAVTEAYTIQSTDAVVELEKPISNKQYNKHQSNSRGRSEDISKEDQYNHHRKDRSTQQHHHDHPTHDRERSVSRRNPSRSTKNIANNNDNDTTLAQSSSSLSLSILRRSSNHRTTGSIATNDISTTPVVSKSTKSRTLKGKDENQSEHGKRSKSFIESNIERLNRSFSYLTNGSGNGNDESSSPTKKNNKMYALPTPLTPTDGSRQRPKLSNQISNRERSRSRTTKNHNHATNNNDQSPSSSSTASDRWSSTDSNHNNPQYPSYKPSPVSVHPKVRKLTKQEEDFFDSFSSIGSNSCVKGMTLEDSNHSVSNRSRTNNETTTTPKKSRRSNTTIIDDDRNHKENEKIISSTSSTPKKSKTTSSTRRRSSVEELEDSFASAVRKEVATTPTRKIKVRSSKISSTTNDNVVDPLNLSPSKRIITVPNPSSPMGKKTYESDPSFQSPISFDKRMAVYLNTCESPVTTTYGQYEKDGTNLASPSKFQMIPVTYKSSSPPRKPKPGDIERSMKDTKTPSSTSNKINKHSVASRTSHTTDTTTSNSSKESDVDNDDWYNTKSSTMRKNIDLPNFHDSFHVPGDDDTNRQQDEIFPEFTPNRFAKTKVQQTLYDNNDDNDRQKENSKINLRTSNNNNPVSPKLSDRATKYKTIVLKENNKIITTTNNNSYTSINNGTTGAPKLPQRRRSTIVRDK